MEYEKSINLLDNKPNQPSKFRIKNWVEINDDSRRMHKTDSQIKFKTSMLKSSLCDYSDAPILVKGTISVVNTADAEVIFKNCALFTDWISEINNTQIDNAEDIDVVKAIYNLTEYSDNYFKKSGSLWQYYRDELALANDAIVDFPGANNNSAAFNFKQNVTGKTEADNTKGVEITVPLKYLSNFRRTLEMPLIDCEISLILTCPTNVCYLMLQLKQQHSK